MGWQRYAAAPGVMVDAFGFSLASAGQIWATAREFARTADLMVLDTIATGSGVLVVREPAGVTVLTDLAGVWPVFYATVGDSVVYSSSASAVTRYVGSEVNERWLAAWLLAGGIPEAWSEGSPYRRVAAVPAGGMLLIYPNGRTAVLRRELPLGTAEFDEGARRLAEALTSAVRGQTTACHELSTDLSGGLDSSTVAALAAATRPDPALLAITLVCPIWAATTRCAQEASPPLCPGSSTSSCRYPARWIPTRRSPRCRRPMNRSRTSRSSPGCGGG